MTVFSAEERAYIDRVAAAAQRWEEQGCPQCGARNPYSDRSERGEVSVTCSVCSWQERFDPPIGAEVSSMRDRAYRVKVETYVVVPARNVKDAKGRAELAVRRAIERSYRSIDDEDRWADGWEGFAFYAVGTPKLWDDGGDA
jgi:hypothetical protein